MVSWLRKRTLVLRPSSRFFISTCMNAPPLPGCVCWVLATFQIPFSYSIMLPGRMSTPLIFIADDLNWERAGAPLARAAPACNVAVRHGTGHHRDEMVPGRDETLWHTVRHPLGLSVRHSRLGGSRRTDRHD